MLRRKQQRRQRNDDGIGCGNAAAEDIGQQCEGRGNGGRGKHDRPGPAGQIIARCKQHLRKPGRRNPGLSGLREGIDVDARQRAVIENPLADGDLPVGIGIVQKHAAVDQQQNIDADPKPEPRRNLAKAGGFLPVKRSSVDAHDENFQPAVR